MPSRSANYGPQAAFDGFTQGYQGYTDEGTQAGAVYFAGTSDTAAFPGNSFLQIQLAQQYSDLAGR